MKRNIYILSLIAITLLASCNSKEKEDKVFARVSSSNNPAEMRAYIDQYFEEAPPGHIVKIRKNLRMWEEDSTAYANIKNTKDLATKVSLENEYISKFKESNHKAEISDMLAKDKKALEIQRVKEEKLAKYNKFKENVVDYIFSIGQNISGYYWGSLWAFGAPDDNGNGKGVYGNNIEAEKITYKLADNGDLQVKMGDTTFSINFMGDGIYVGDKYYPRSYAPKDYKDLKKKYFK